MVEIKQTHQKEIIALDTFEAVRLRPQMYISQISLMDDKVPLIKDEKLTINDKLWSPGFMHLLVEILENAIDEAKRMKGKMKNINVSINLDTNEVSVRDEGDGFHKAHTKHSKTKKNIVRTAFEELHSGSNFSDTEHNVLGTNGVGSAVCNILSKKFEVITTNKTHSVHYIWDDYKVIFESIEERTKEKLGTEVKFIPSKDVFKELSWDIEIVQTYLSFKQFLLDRDSNIKNLKINASFIKNSISTHIKVSSNFLPKENIIVDKEVGTIILWPSYENSCSVSFVNGSQCTGIHQKVVQDWLNDYFKYNLAHHFYDTLIILNVPSTLMKFQDQNKTRFATSRIEIEELLESSFKTKLLKQLKESKISSEIEKKIEERMYAENIKTIKKAQKTSKRKISDKYSPASKYKDNIFLCEGASASGSLIQARDAERDGVYSLKGKVKNTKKLSDLSQNKEILDLMSILNLDPSEKNTTTYKNIIIATDSDADGEHITSLIINLFHKWFPYVIEQGKLMKLVTPLVVCDYNNKRKYFYSLEEFNIFTSKNKVTNINYLKGLGSLSINDWENVMKDKILFQIMNDKNSDDYLEMAFGESANERKKWLSGIPLKHKNK